MSRAKTRAPRKPVYMSMKKVADALGVERDTARKWCIKEKCARKIGRDWFTTREQFIAAFPEAARNLGA